MAAAGNDLGLAPIAAFWLQRRQLHRPRPRHFGRGRTWPGLPTRIRAAWLELDRASARGTGGRHLSAPFLLRSPRASGRHRPQSSFSSSLPLTTSAEGQGPAAGACAPEPDRGPNAPFRPPRRPAPRRSPPRGAPLLTHQYRGRSIDACSGIATGGRCRPPHFERACAASIATGGNEGRRRPEI